MKTFRSIFALSLTACGSLATLFTSACSSLSEAKLPVTPFVLGLQEFKGNDSITIDEVRSTSPLFAIGDKVIVSGHYQLASHTRANLGLYLAPTGKNENVAALNPTEEPVGSESLIGIDAARISVSTTCDQVDPLANPHMPDPPSYPVEYNSPDSDWDAYYYKIRPFDAQELKIEKGSGTFTLVYTIKQTGVLHLSFYTVAGLKPFGGVYFGTEIQMAALKNWSLTNQSISLVDFPFIIGREGFRENDRIVIQQVLATSPELEIGTKVVVRGHYQLASHEQAILSLGMGKNNNQRSKRTNRIIINKGSGEFTLAYEVSNMGSLHVSFYGVPDGYVFGGAYFGTEKQNIQNWPDDPAGDRSLND